MHSLDLDLKSGGSGFESQGGLILHHLISSLLAAGTSNALLQQGYWQ
jgi:hypothetical protein